MKHTRVLLCIYKLASREDGDGNLRNDEEKDESNPSSKLCFARSSLSHGQLDMEEEEEDLLQEAALSAAGCVATGRRREEKRGGSNSRAGRSHQLCGGKGIQHQGHISRAFLPYPNSILSFRFCTHYLTSMFALHLTHITIINR